MWTKRLLYNYYILTVTADVGQYVKCTRKKEFNVCQFQQSFQMSHNTCLIPRLSHRQFLFTFGMLQEIKNLTVGRPESEATVTL